MKPRPEPSSNAREARWRAAHATIGNARALAQIKSQGSRAQLRDAKRINSELLEILPPEIAKAQTWFQTFYDDLPPDPTTAGFTRALADYVRRFVAIAEGTRRQTMTAERMPVLFAGHGNPMNAILDNKWSQGFRRLGELVPRPKAVLAVSAHWYVPGTYLMGNHDPKTIHDFGGFPRELYEVQYPAPGFPGLAEDASRLLAPWKASVRSDWGLDHGTWSVLRHMYPKADVPIVQLSIDGHAPIQAHYDIGQALQPLREQGVLIVGSGNLVHNLRSAFAKMRAGISTRESWATDFDERTASNLQNRDRSGLEQACAGPDGHLAHPSPDHYIPILYAAGAAGRDADVSFPVEGFDMGDISMRAVLFG